MLDELDMANTGTILSTLTITVRVARRPVEAGANRNVCGEGVGGKSKASADGHCFRRPFG